MSRHGEIRYCKCGCGNPAKRMIYNGVFKSWRAYASGHSPCERIEIKIPNNPVDLSYAAGIIDGEGCIWGKGPYMTPTKGLKTQVILQVTMCSDSVIKWLHETFGGEVFITQPPSAKHRLRFSWQVRGRLVFPILQALLPYLKEKSQRAIFAIELSNDIAISKPGRKNPLTEAQIERRSFLTSKIKEFNRNPIGEDLEKSA